MSTPRPTGGEPRKRSLFTLIADIPSLITNLIRAELEQLKDEILGKLKHAGIGIGLLAGAGAFLFFALAVFVTAAILGLATVLPAWAAALIVGGALLVFAVILVLIGVANLKKGVPPAPTKTISSVKKDVNALKGIGKRES
ncbi:MAG: phage holin family protein [Rhodoglobus sp.]